MGDVPQFVQVPVPSVNSPLVTKKRLAELLGPPITEGIVLGWANKGLLGPLVHIGKYSLINLELLRKQCLDREFK